MAVPVLKVSEFNKICRVCLMVKKEMRPLFGDLIPTMMETCTTVKISREDSLPKFLCMQCVHQLSRAFTFKSLVEKSDSILRKFLTSCPTLDIMPNNSTEIVQTDGSAEIITDDVTEPDQSSMQIFDEEKKDNITYHVMEGEENGNEAEEIKEKELQPEKEDESDEDTFLELATFQASQSMVPGRCICNLCHKEFKNTKWLKGHMALHSNWIKANCKKMLKCKLCQRAFKGPGMLKMHMRTHEEKMQVVPTCTVCGRTFSSKAMLYRHRQTHFEKKTYPCGICSKTFVSNYALQSHIARHRGERRFSCISCGKSFYNSTDLKVHMRLHTGEKPLKCGDCGKAFRRHSTLCQHVKKHRGIRTHTCEICNRAFFELSKLAAHRRVHTGEKPFECEVCTRRFAQQSALVYHKRTHTGERPYSCTVCHMRFTTSSARNSHMMMHGSDSRKSSVSDGPEPVKRPRILKEKASRTNTADAEISEDHVIQLPNNLEVPANSIYICATCNKSYTEVNQWKKHMKKHEMPSKQDEEDKPEVKIQSNSNASMQVEVQANSAVSTNDDLLVERSKLRYACHMCKKHYAHITTLEKHIKTHHNLLLITEDTAANYQQQVKLQQQHQDHHLQQQQQQQQQHQQHHQQQQMQQIQVTQLNQQTQPHLQLQHGTILQPQIHVQQLQQPHQQIVQQHPQQIAVSTVQTLQVQQQQQQHQTVAVQAQQLLQPVQVQAIQLAGQPSHHHHHHHQHPLQLAVQQQMHVAQTNCHLPSIVQVPASVVNSLQQQELTAIGSNITHRIILQPQHHVAQPHTTTVYLHH